MLSRFGESKQGLATGNNDTFLRFWFEISSAEIGFNINSTTDSVVSRKKWFPYNKGGARRKWFGNQELVVNWKNDGEAIKDFRDNNGKLRSRPQNTDYYFRPSISWGLISGPFFRYFPKGFIYDIQGMSFFPINENEIYHIISWMNSKVFRIIGKVINPREQYQAGDLLRLPASKAEFGKIGILNISISKQDWDAHETSWDFETNPLLAVDEETYIDNIHHEIEHHEKETGEHLCIDPAAPELDSLEWRMGQYKQKWEHLFMQLHANEEELNRQFIDIYGLQDDLTPDVPLDEITILQQGEIKISDQYELCDSYGSVFADSDGAILTTSGDLYLDWQDDVVMKQFISYAVGCMMGRYRLDKKGLHIAHPNPTANEIAPYIYNKVEFEIDEDGIIPLMPNDCGFSDNASNRFSDFVRIALGDEKHVENLNFVEKCLGKSVEQYFVKDFWKDHKKMYQNRPIYWLFASKKGAFQCIAYMHRMNAYTAERIRAKYLLPYIENLQARITDLDNRRSELNTRESKQLQQLTKTLEECQEYHDRLQVVAEQAIAFDLDDGVVVNYAKFGDVVQKIK